MKKIILRKILIMLVTTLLIGIVIAPIAMGIEKNLYNNKEDLIREDWWDLDWAYRKQITIDHNKVSGDLSNFPVLIHNISSDFHENAQSDGDDFVFVSDNHNDKYSHEIEFYQSSSGELVAWVKIPNLSDSSDTVFFIYYGNPNCASQQDPDEVWDSDFIHVWHLGDDLEDSAGSDDGTNYGAGIISGKIGKARDFEQSESDYINFGDMAQPGDGSLTTMTWEGWVKPETQDIELMTKYNSQGSDYSSYYIGFIEGGKFRSGAASSFGVSTKSITVNVYSVVGQWVYLASTFTLGGVNDIVPFIDGVEVSDTQPSSNGNYMRNIPVSDDIGRYRPESGTEYTDAVIDEVRWSKVVRSDDWIETSYNTMNDPSSFLTIGPEEDQNFNHQPDKPSNPNPTNGATDVALDANISWTGSDPDGDPLTYDVYFGTNSPPPLVSTGQSEAYYNPGALEICTTYYWQIEASDDSGESNIGPIWNFITRCTGPPDIPDINGPKIGNTGKDYTYTFVSQDPENDNIFYQIDWGDGSFDDWFGPFESNDIATKQHKWDNQGNFTIKARGKDEFDAIGEWGTFTVTMPRNKVTTYSLILHFLEQFPLLERFLYFIN